MNQSGLWKEAIREIRLAQRANRLVLFVGAGVSANSGILTWEKLIRKVAREIGYDNCHKCKAQNGDCPKADCQYRYEFTQQDFIRIPDYFSDSFEQERQGEYYQFLENALRLKEARPNPINEEIFRIMPHHIITTNFDTLLEDTTASNRGLYDVIHQDEDLLRYPSDRYIIKMHGDFTQPQSIVLKEGDYLEYENTHPLISAFIRSLLINHTFAFLGYGLNDYNLNLIISWINYFRKAANAPSTVRNFLITDKIPVAFEKRRLENQGITVISLSDIPPALAAEAPASITDPRGRQLYAFVKSISTPSLEEKVLTLEEILNEKFEDFAPYRKIAVPDLLGAYNFHDARIRSSRLEITDPKEFENLQTILSRSPRIESVLSRTGIEEIVCTACASTPVPINIPVPVNTPETNIAPDSAMASSHPFETLRLPPFAFWRDPLFRLEIDNDYIALKKKVEKQGTIFEKLYYSWLHHESPRKLALQAENQVVRDPLQTLINKVRAYYGFYKHSDQRQEKEEEINAIFQSLPIQKDYSFRFLRYLFEYPSQNRNKMEVLLHKLDQALDPNSSAFDPAQAMKHFWLLRSYAYDYYYFLKANLIPLDSYKDSRDYLRPYLRALISLSRRDLPEVSDVLCPMENGILYALNETDLDLLVKFGDPVWLRRTLGSYRSDELHFQNGIALVRKSENLMASIQQDKEAPALWVGQLYLLVVICFHTQISSWSRAQILQKLIELMTGPTTERIRLALFDPLFYAAGKAVAANDQHVFDPALKQLAAWLIHPEARQDLQNIDPARFSQLVEKLKDFYATEARQRLKDQVLHMESPAQKTEAIERYYPILSRQQIQFELHELLPALDPRQLTPLVRAGLVHLDQKQIGQLFQWLSKQRTSHPGTLRPWLRELVRLCLNHLPIQVPHLSQWEGHLSQIDFLLDPDGFDYSRVDLRDGLWQEMIFSPLCQPWFKKHSAALLNEKVRLRFLNHVQSEQEEKIVYGLLLPDALLEDFPQKSADQLLENTEQNSSTLLSSGQDHPA